MGGKGYLARFVSAGPSGSQLSACVAITHAQEEGIEGSPLSGVSAFSQIRKAPGRLLSASIESQKRSA